MHWLPLALCFWTNKRENTYTRVSMQTARKPPDTLAHAHDMIAHGLQPEHPLSTQSFHNVQKPCCLKRPWVAFIHALSFCKATCAKDFPSYILLKAILNRFFGMPLERP